MKQLLIILAIILCTSIVYGQSEDHEDFQDTVFLKYKKGVSDGIPKYETDTVIFASEILRHFLVGTTIIPWTNNQQLAKGEGLYFDKVTKTDCQKSIEDNNDNFFDQINSIVLTDTSLIIDINITENCCYDFLCDISVDSSNLLNLLYTGYGVPCSCDCCFGMTYHFSILGGLEYTPVTGVMINGNRKTLREVKRKN